MEEFGNGNHVDRLMDIVFVSFNYRVEPFGNAKYFTSIRAT